MSKTKAISPGYYTATITSYGLKFVGDDNKPVANIGFQLTTQDGETETAWYRGFLTEKAKTYTIRDLVTLGFADKDMGRFAQGMESGALDTTQSYRIKVINEEYKGETYSKVKGIYPAKTKTELTYDQLAQAGQISVAAEVMAAKADKGLPGNMNGKATVKAGTAANDDLPF